MTVYDPVLNIFSVAIIRVYCIAIRGIFSVTDMSQNKVNQPDTAEPGSF
jgi:hypothetical protein